MAEPDPKKAKLSTEGRKTFNFTKENDAYDRVLLVGNISFRVHSETLIEHSDYFRVMFTSDFLEKDKNEIEIKDVEVKEMKMFLSALFKPEMTAFRDKDVPLLCEVFSFFQAGDYLVQFLEENKVFKRFPVGDLIQLGLERGIPQMKTVAESFLVAEFNDKFPIITRKSTEKAKDFKFDKVIIGCLDLVSKFDLEKLKEVVEARLSADYVRGKHSAQSENKYVELMREYLLEDLKKVIEPFAIDFFNKHQNQERQIFECYIKQADPVKMTQLKETMENFFLAEYKNIEHIPMEYKKYLNIANAYVMNNLKEYIENQLIESTIPHNARRSMIFECWVAIRNRYISNEEAIIIGAPRDIDVPEFLTEVLAYSDHNNHHRLKAAIGKMLIDGMSTLNENKHSQYHQFVMEMLKFAKYFEKIKIIIENYLIAKFTKELNKVHVASQFLKLCSKYGFIDLKTRVENYYIEKLKNVDGLNNAFIQQCSDCSIKYKMAKIEEAFESYLIKDFQNSRSFKNLKFAFVGFSELTFDDNNFEAFRKTVTDFLKTVTLDDVAMNVGRKYIYKLPTEQKIFIFDAMFGNKNNQ